MLTGQNGILNRAAEAKGKTETAQKDEKNRLQNYNDIIKQYTENSGIIMPEATTITKPYLPSNAFSKKEGNLDIGLVIQDKNGNEYVWIEVPKTTDIYSKSGLNLKEFTPNNYVDIENDLCRYASIYRNNVNYMDEYSEDTTNGWFKTKEEYNEQKNKMLKSIYENGGFWVGRYETGIDYKENRRNYGTDYYTEHDLDQIPVIKKNAYPYNWVRRSQAKYLAASMESGNYSSSLMFGIQFDLILAFLHNKGQIDNGLLTVDSKTIGNYSDNLWNITNMNAKYSVNYGVDFFDCPYEKKSNQEILLSTGANDKFSTMNIYDLAGNVYEWVLEMTNEDGGACVYRGGVDYSTGAERPVNYRDNDNTMCSYNTIGFRISIY